MKRTIWAAPVVVALIMAMTVPAAAGVNCDDPRFADHARCQTDPPPDDGPVLVEVTMEPVEGRGLATTCEVSETEFSVVGPLAMYRSAGAVIDNPGGGQGYSLSPAEDPVLGVEFPEVQWQRKYPDPWYESFGTGFTGCHRMLLDPNEPESLYGGLMIDLDDTGAVTGLLWHFDYWYVWGERGSKKNPTPYVTEFEQFTLKLHPEAVDASGEPIYRWVDNTPDDSTDIDGTLTAEFWLSYHLQGYGYQLMPGSKQTLSFTIQVAEVTTPES